MVRKSSKIAFLFIVLFSLTCFYYFTVFIPATKSLCKREVESVIRNAINQSNEVIVNKSLTYDDVFTVTYSDDKEVTSVRANVGLINQLAMLWGTEIQNRLNNKKEVLISRPAGAFSGSVFLSQFGKEVTLHCTFSAISSTDYSSVFIRQGVNQTLHRLYLEAKVEATVLSPYSSQTLEVRDTFLFSEAVINGKVPGTFISSENFNEYLDLLGN